MPSQMYCSCEFLLKDTLICNLISQVKDQGEKGCSECSDLIIKAPPSQTAL